MRALLGGQIQLGSHGRHGQRHRERRTRSHAHALCPDGPAVQLDELLRDGEPKTQPAMTPRGRSVRLPEALEQVRKELGMDALADVRHAHLNLRIHARERDLHAADPAA